MDCRPNRRPALNACAAVLALASLVSAQEPLAFDPAAWSAGEVVRLELRGERPETFEGRPVALQRDLGGLFQSEAGRLKVVYWEDVRSAGAAGEPFTPLTADELSAALQEASPESRALSTDHYVVLYRGQEAYAQWIVRMYERLYRGFYAYWGKLGVELAEPKFPMVVNVFATRQGFLEQAAADSLEGAEAMIGYYHLHTNQTVSYDLTESQTLAPPGRTVNQGHLLRAILARPQAERTVATIVHEAVHQLAYNSGLQVRLADNPLWLSEGIAMFFESPDLSMSQGWSGIGKVNAYQLAVFKSLPAAEGDWVTELIRDDATFQNAASVNAAYARSWALTYYLIKARPRQFAAYMKEIGGELPLQPTDPRRRLEMFGRHFGEPHELPREVARLIARQ